MRIKVYALIVNGGGGGDDEMRRFLFLLDRMDADLWKSF